MVRIHFPCIEAGRVKPLCGAPHANLDWTTMSAKVTCPRCRHLLRSGEGGEARSTRAAAAEAGYTTVKGA